MPSYVVSDAHDNVNRACGRMWVRENLSLVLKDVFTNDDALLTESSKASFVKGMREELARVEKDYRVIAGEGEE